MCIARINLEYKLAFDAVKWRSLMQRITYQKWIDAYCQIHRSVNYLRVNNTFLMVETWFLLWRRPEKNVGFCLAEAAMWFNLHHLLLGVQEAFRDVVQGLVLGDRVLRLAGLAGFKGQELRSVTHGVLQLPEGGEQSGAVRLDLAVLAAHSELHREPVTLHVEED